MPIKPGLQTTEFWVALAPIVAALLAIFGVHVDSNTLTQVLTGVAGLLAAVYVLGRSIVKASHQRSHTSSVFHDQARQPIVAEAPATSDA